MTSPHRPQTWRHHLRRDRPWLLALGDAYRALWVITAAAGIAYTVGALL